MYALTETKHDTLPFYHIKSLHELHNEVFSKKNRNNNERK